MIYIVILAIAILILAVIAIPLRINLVGSVGLEGTRFDARVGLIYGLIAFRFIQREKKYVEFLPLNLKLFRKELNDKKEDEEGKKESRRSVKWLFRLPKLMENAQETPELRKPAARFLAKLRTAIKVKDLNFYSRAGLGDPYITGVLYGCYCAFSGFLGNWIPCGIYLQPDFVNEGLQGEVYAEIEVVQSSLIIPVMLLVTRKSFRDLMSFRGKKE